MFTLIGINTYNTLLPLMTIYSVFLSGCTTYKLFFPFRLIKNTKISSQLIYQ